MVFIFFTILSCAQLELPAKEKGHSLSEFLNRIPHEGLAAVIEKIEGESEGICKVAIDEMLRALSGHAPRMQQDENFRSLSLEEIVTSLRGVTLCSITYEMLKRKHAQRCALIRSYGINNFCFLMGYNILHVAVIFNDHEVFNEFFDLALLDENEVRGFRHNPLELLLSTKPEVLIQEFLEKTRESLTNDLLSSFGALHIAASLYHEKLVEYMISERGLDLNRQFFHSIPFGLGGERKRFKFSVFEAMNQGLIGYLSAARIDEKWQILHENNRLLSWGTDKVPINEVSRRGMIFPIFSAQSVITKQLDRLIRGYKSKSEREIERDAKAYSNVISLLRNKGYKFEDERGFMGQYPVVTGVVMYLGGEALESLLEMGMKIDLQSSLQKSWFCQTDSDGMMDYLERIWPCVRLDTLNDGFLREIEGVAGSLSFGLSFIDTLKGFSEKHPNYVEFLIRFARRHKTLPLGGIAGKRKTLLDLMRKKKFERRFIELAAECGFKTEAQLRREDMANEIRRSLEIRRKNAEAEIAKLVTIESNSNGRNKHKQKGLQFGSEGSKVSARESKSEFSNGGSGQNKHSASRLLAEGQRYEDMNEEGISLAFESILAREDYEELKRVAPLINLEGFRVDWDISRDERVRKLLIRQGVLVDRELLLSVIEMDQLAVAKILTKETDMSRELISSIKPGEMRYSTSASMARILGLNVQPIEANGSSSDDLQAVQETEFKILINREESYIEEGLVTQRVIERLKDMRCGRFGDTKKLDGEIWEARLLGHSEDGNVRIYYRAKKNKILVLAVAYKGEDKASQRLLDRIGKINVEGAKWQIWPFERQ